MTATLRVAFDMTFPSRNRAGSGVYANELLAELNRREDVSMVTVSAQTGGGFPETMRWLTGNARGAVAGSRLVHCPAFVAPWRLGVPFVLTVHDTSTEKYPEDHSLEWRTYTRLFLAERVRAATRVITGTEHSRADIIRDLNVPAERVTVTPYGVSERFSRTSAARSSAAHHALLLFPGAPTRRKNLELVLDAMANAPQGSALGRARLAITGATAEGFPHHSERVKSLGLENRVDWRGKVPADAMPDVIQAADLVVYPSFHEGFGFPALEAMAAGTPVLASNVSCLPEVLGDAALLVDPDDVRDFIAAAGNLLEKPDLRRKLIARGMTRAAQFTWRRCAELTTQVYRDAVIAHKGAGSGS
jgi:glycosyltransferase involved in cell wall biosynthesis